MSAGDIALGAAAAATIVGLWLAPSPLHRRRRRGAHDRRAYSPTNDRPVVDRPWPAAGPGTEEDQR